MDDCFINTQLTGDVLCLSLSIFLFVWLSFFFSFLFLGERGTSFGDKKLNMMNECLGLPIWPGRLVSVVKITAIAV